MMTRSVGAVVLYSHSSFPDHSCSWTFPQPNTFVVVAAILTENSQEAEFGNKATKRLVSMDKSARKIIRW